MICNTQGTVLWNITPDKGGFNYYVYFMANAQRCWIDYKVGSWYQKNSKQFIFFPSLFWNYVVGLTCLPLPPNLQWESIVSYQKLFLPLCHAPLHPTVV